MAARWLLLLPCLFTLLLFSACQNTKNTSQRLPAKTGTTPEALTAIPAGLQLKYDTGIRDIIEDQHGNFWIGSHQQGVALFNGDSIRYFSIDDGLTNNQVRSIQEDAEGNIWFETGYGLCYYNGEQIISMEHKDYSSKENWQLSDQDLWFKGNEGHGINPEEGLPGVYRYDGSKLIYQVFPLKHQTDQGFAYSVSTKAVRGRTGRVWFGTYSAVIGYDGTAFTIFDNDGLGFHEGVGYLHVRSLYEDNKGDLWIGNNGIGVLKYNGHTMTNISEKNGLIGTLSTRSGGHSPAGTLEHVFAITEDRQGNMWFGDRDTGVWKYDGKTFVNYTELDGLTATHVWVIYETQKGEIWLGMEDGSVCRFNGSSFDKIL